MLKISQILIEKYQSDIPPTVESMIELPGIGKKMAYLCMSVAWGKVVGIGVDTHVHRISQRLEWIEPSKDPEKTRLQLEQFVPELIFF